MDRTHFSGFSLQILGFFSTLQPRGLFLASVRFFFEKCRSNIYIYIYLGDLWINSTAPRNEHSKTDFPRFEISKIWNFPGKVRRMKTFFPGQIWSCYRRDAGTCSMGWLRSVRSIKLYDWFSEYPLFYRALLQKRPIILSILLTEATP